MVFKLICGAPGAGKNHYVSQRFKDGDVIVDFDSLYTAVTGQGKYVERNPEMIRVISQIRMTLLDELMHVKGGGTVWAIMCLPEGRRREFTARRFRSAEQILILPAFETCIEHICGDEAVEGQQEHRKQAAREWYKKYTPSTKDIIMS